MVICVTSRRLCKGSFLDRIEEIAAARPWGILLREKDLSETEYTALARTCSELCSRYGTQLVLHSRPELAAELGLSRVHYPYPLFERQAGGLDKAGKAGVSVHSVSEAARAEAEGADCLIAGHVFATSCKQGVPPRGTSFLREVCRSVSVPVFAIGGITAERVPSVLAAGASGICLMSELMQCPDPGSRIAAYHELIKQSKEGAM